VIAIGVVLYPVDRKAPVSMVLSATPDPHDLTTDVINPALTISSHHNGSVMMSLQLECEVNGTWIPWPPQKSNDVTRLADIITAKWQATLAPNSHIVTQPNPPPRENTTNLVRVHGYIAKEKTGLSKFAERVRTHFILRDSKDPTLKEMAWDEKFRSYPDGTEYVTSTFYLTNQLTPVAVSLEPRPVGQ
jgi:hypothetical protein